MEIKTKPPIVYSCLVLALCASAFLFCMIDPVWFEPSMEHSINSQLLWYLIPNRSRFDLALANFVIRLFYPGIVGMLGLYYASKIGLNGILNDEIKQGKNILLTISVGIIMGGYFIGYETLSDLLLNKRILQYQLSIIPSAIFNSFAEGVGDQIMQMFYISLLVWLFSKIIKSESGRNKLYWVASAICALGYSIVHTRYTHIYSSKNLYPYFFQNMGIIIGLYGPLSMACAYFLKRFGLLSAIIIHFITDISWRVLWAYVKWGDLVFKP
jgi:hypothetical protein